MSKAGTGWEELLHGEESSPRATDKGCPDWRGSLSCWVMEHTQFGYLTQPNPVITDLLPAEQAEL